MEALKKVLVIAWNDVRIELADRSSLIFLVMLPLVFTFILATALGGAGGGASRESGSADKRFVLPVVDEDHSRLSGALLDALQVSSVVRPVPRTQAEAAGMLKDQRLSVLTIPAGFEAALTSAKPAEVRFRRAQGDAGMLAAEQAVEEAAGQLSGEVGAALASAAEAERVRPFESDAARQAYFEQGLGMARQLLSNPPATIKMTSAPEARQPEANAFQQSSAGQLVTWVMITLVGVAEVLVNERVWGTLRRLVVTPTGKAAILGGKITGRLGLGLAQMGLMIGFGAWVLGVDWGRSPIALLLVLSAFALAAVAFGVMLGTFATTRNQAMWLIIFFGMVLSALGGAWWPLEVTPPLYQQVVKVLPTTWAMQGLTDVVVRGQGVAAILPEVGVLLAFAAAFFAVGIGRFRYEWGR